MRQPHNLIVRYIINLDKIYGDDKWRIYQPSAGRNQYVPAGEDTYYLGKGIIEAGYATVGSANFGTYDFLQNFLWYLTYQVVPQPKINLPMIAHLGAIGDAWTHTGFALNELCIDWNVETFYILLWEVLHNKSINENEQNALLKKALKQLDDGPCEGPYCYVSKYNDDGSINNNNPVTSGNGWGSTYRWEKLPIFQDYGDWFTGNYSGLDYMLLHNLYYIITKHDNLNYFVNYVDKQVGMPAPIQLSAFGSAHGTDDSPLNFIGFNSIVSTQLINDDIIHLYPYNPPPNSTPHPGNVTYKAQNVIKLEPGFHAKAGCYFHAYIEDIDCNEEGSKSISEYPDNVITMVYDSLVSVTQSPYPLTIDDDTSEVVFTDTLACPLDTIHFTGIIGDTIGDVFSYYWDFGNGQTSTLKTPKIFYDAPGIYNFRVAVTDTYNVTDTFKAVIVVPDCGGRTIKGHLYQSVNCGGAPIANAEILLISATSDTINTLAITDSTGKFVIDLTQLPALDTTQTYTFATQQGYVLEPQLSQTINMLVSEGEIELYFARPQVLILTDTLVCLGNTSYFNALISGGVPPYTYLWASGNQTISDENFEYILPFPGMYNIELTVTDALGCTGATNTTINVVSCVQPQIISGTLLHNNTCGSLPVENAMMLLISSALDTIYTYIKTDITGNFNLDVAQLANIDTTQTYIFATQQGYVLEPQQPKTINSLISKGNIELHIAPPLVIIITDTLICLGDTSYFNSKISGGAPPYTYLWASGNLTTSEESFKYTLPLPGEYKIELTVTDALGCSISAGTLINVSPCEIKGFLYENYSCSGVPVIGDTLILKLSGTAANTLASAVTQVDGSFSLSYDVTALSDNMALYVIESQSDMGITDMQARTISEWQQISPLQLYYTALVNQEWIVEYSGIDTLGATAIAMDVNDNIYIAGTTYSTSGQNYLVMKYNPAGVLQWAATDNSITSAMRAIAVDSVENVYVTGSSNDIITAKYNADGDQLWLRTYSCGDSAGVFGNYIVRDYDGNIVVAVSRTSYYPSTDYYWEILKYSPSGQLLWTKKHFTDSESNSILSLSVDSSNNIVISANGWTIGQTSDIVCSTVKFDASGTLQWVKRYLGAPNGYEVVYPNTFDNEGNVIVMGSVQGLNTGLDIKTFKYDTGGNNLWEVTYNDPNNMDESGKIVMTDASDNIYVCGNTSGASSMFLVIKYDSNGSALWVKKYAYKNNNFNWLYHAVLDIEGSVYLSGITNSLFGSSEFLTVKFNSDGVFQWAETYYVSDSGNDFVNKVLVSSKGDVYATGTHYNINVPNIFTVKYSQCPSLEQNLKMQNQESNINNAEVMETGSYKIGIMPNPYNNYTNIAYEIYDASDAQIEVYTVTGQKVKEIENSKQAAGYYHYTFSAQKLGFTPGLYILRIRINNEVQNFRLVELKN